MRILIVGGTGLVGRKLGLNLTNLGHEMVALVRDVGRAKKSLPYPASLFEWTHGEIPPAAFDGVEAVINLAGESIAAKRWTSQRKKALIQSRVDLTRRLILSLKRHGFSVRTYIGASAVGFYGDRGDEVLYEHSPAGENFLASLCQDWEGASLELPASCRRIIFRLGVVLERDVGFLAQVVPLFRSGFAGRLGSGQQWISWIHIEDLVDMISKALSENSLSGEINAVSPNPIRNINMTKSLAHFFSRPAVFPAPRWVLSLVLGELSQLLLSSQRVSCEKIKSYGFVFRFETFEDALRNLYERTPRKA